jgi:hypothetical protein
MATIRLVSNIFDSEVKTINTENGITLRNLIDKYSGDNSYKKELVECYYSGTGQTTYEVLDDSDGSELSVIATVNNKSESLDYVVKEDDVISVIILPGGGSAGKWIRRAVSLVFGPMSNSVGFIVAAFNGDWDTAFKCLIPFYGNVLTADYITGSGSKKKYKTNAGLEGQQALGVRGAQNQSIVGNSFPVVIGKHLTTPFICGSPYSVSVGDYGIDQEIRTLYAVGYAPLKLTDFKLGSLMLAHNKKWDNNPDLKTIMHGKLSGVADDDKGEITNVFYNNDIEIEILQQDPNSDTVDYGTIYPEAVIETSVKATPLFIADKDLDDVAQTKYKGQRFPRYFRNNSVRFSQSCPRKIQVELNAGSGLYGTRVKSSDSSSRTEYWSIPVWYAIQYRLYSSKNAASNAENPSGWISFTKLNSDTNHPVEAREFTEEERTKDLDAHTGNTFNSDVKSSINAKWVGEKLFNFQDVYDNDVPENNVSEMRFTGSVELSINECKRILEADNPSKIVEVRVIRISPCYYDETSSEGENGPASFQDVIQWNTLTTFKFDEDKLDEANIGETKYNYRVYKETWSRIYDQRTQRWGNFSRKDAKWVYINESEVSSYQSKIENEDRDYFDYQSYSIQEGYGAIVCGSYENYREIDQSGYASYYTYTELKTDEIPPDVEVPALRPLSEENMRKLCIVAIKAKADVGGNIQGQLDKFSVVAEAFQPFFDLSTKKIFPENVRKTKEYYYPKYYDENTGKWIKGEKITASSEDEEKKIYESLRMEGKDAVCYKRGNDYVQTLSRLIFADQFKDSKGRYFLNTDENSSIRKCNETNAISSALYWLVGPHAGIDAKGYDDINILSAEECFEGCNAVIDGSTYGTKVIDADGTVHNADDEVVVKYSANGWIYQQSKAETVLSSILTAGRSLFNRDNYNRIQFIFDKKEDFPTMIVNQQNCISSTVAYSYEETPSGISIQFPDENDEFENNTIWCMEDAEDYKNPEKALESLKLDFVTNPYQAWSLGRYVLANRILNKKVVTAKVGWEGFNAELLNTCVVQLPTLLLGTDFGGRIVRLIEDDDYVYGFICNELYKFTGETEFVDGIEKNKQGVEIFQQTAHGKNNCICLRLALEGTEITVDETENGVTEKTVYKAEKGQTNVVLFDRKISKSDESINGEVSDLLYYKPKVDNLVNFGYVGVISETYKITKIKADKDFNYELTLILYNENLYRYGDKLPSFQNNMTIPNRGMETFQLTNDLTPDILASKIAENSALITETAVKAVESGKDSSNPPTPTGLYGYAQKDSILLRCNPPEFDNTESKLSQNISSYVWYINKKDRYEEIGSSTSSNFTYDFNRITDGFPEKEDISEWKIAVKGVNLYGKESELAEAKINISDYGTWIFGTPRNINVTATESGLDIAWNVDYDKKMYGSLKHTVTVYYEDDVVKEYTTNGLVYTYKFNRTTDKYPEKTVVYNSIDTDVYKKSTSLGKYKVVVSSQNIESGVVKTGDETNPDETYYKTWIPTITIGFVSAEKERLGITWNRQNNLYGNESFNITVSHGDYKKEIPSLIASSYNYTFSRKDDGYPEAEDFSDWEVGIVHFNEVYSSEKSTAIIDASDYGTWVPPVPSNPVIIAKKDNLELKWGTYDTPREFYGDLRYRIDLYYNSTNRVRVEQKGNSHTYKFNRTLDKYPETHDMYEQIKETCPGASDLSLYSFTVTSFDALSKNESESVGNISTDTTEYKTWTVPQVNATSLSANKEGLTAIWETNSDLSFGDIRYKVEFIYDGDVINSTEKAIETKTEYVFDRDFDKDGFPEKKSVLDALKEVGITSKGRCLDLYSLKVTAFTLQCPEFTTDSDLNCSTRGYGTWVPDYSHNSLISEANQNGVSSEITTSPSSEEYGLPYSFEFGIQKEKNAEWMTRISDSSKYEYIFKDEYPEAEDLQKWKVRCRPISTAGVPALYYNTVIPDTNSYGTWKLGVPDVATRVSDRTITLIMGIPKKSVEQYGNIKYRIKIRRPGYDEEGVWFKPGRTLDPYGLEDNYKDGDGYIETGSVYTQTMPLEGQSSNDLKDTLYQFSITAISEAGKSEPNETVFETALCTNIRDIVHANETAKEAYISKLSAITANVGTIKEGSLSGNDKNYWNLSTFIDDDTGQKRWQGAMRVGGDDQYLLVEPQIKNNDVVGYNITFKVGNFEISSYASNINGELIITKDSTSLDRTRITPDGTFYEHRETVASEWFSISQMTTAGIISNSLISDYSIVVTNMSIQERRKLGHDIGIPFLSDNSRVWHFDTDLNDQNQQTDLSILSTGELKLVGNKTKGNLDYTPAILAVAPYSETANSLFGQYQILRNISATNSLTIDFWIQYIWCENQVLFDIGTKEDRVRLIVRQNEQYWNIPEADEPMWNNEVEMTGDVIVWNEPSEASISISHIGANHPNPDEDNEKTFKQMGIFFEPNSWLHFGVILSEDTISVFINKTSVSFVRYERLVSDIVLILNKNGDELENTFILDELMIDNTACEDFESFSRNTDSRIPWGKLDYREKHFIFDTEGLVANEITEGKGEYLTTAEIDTVFEE